MGTAFIDNLQRHAIFDGLAHRVFVDVVAEDAFCLVDGRAGVADACCVRNALIEIRSQH